MKEDGALNEFEVAFPGAGAQRRLNPILRKEIRLLLPAFLVAMSLAIAPVWLLPPQVTYCCEGHLAYIATPFGSMPHYAFAVGVVILALSAFAREFSFGTFPALFTQPVMRRRIWNMKTGFVGGALLVTTLAFVLSAHTHDVVVSYREFGAVAGPLVDPSSWWYLTIGPALVALLAFAGGQWTTLAFRQIGASMFLTVLTPYAVAFLTVRLWGYEGYEEPPYSMVIPFLVYAAAAILWARSRFQQPWDTHPAAVMSFLPGIRWAGRGSSTATISQRRTASGSLVMRELQLQRVSLWIGSGLLVFHLVTLALRGLWLDSEPTFVLSAGPWLWILLSCLVGGTAIAEERSQGTLEVDLALPGARRRRFVIKLGVVLTLGLLFGAVAPWTIETLALSRQIPNLLFSGVFDGRLPEWYNVNLGSGSEMRVTPLLWAALVFASTLFAFFFSSLSRYTFNALAATAALIYGGQALWTLYDVFFFRFSFEVFENCSDCSAHRIFDLWRGPLIFLIGAPVLVSVLVGLSYRNYTRNVAGWRPWIRSMAVLALALVFIETATAAVYARPWERLGTLEPRAGPARLSGPVQPKTCSGNPWERNVSVLLPDGRIWEAEDFRFEELTLSPLGWSARVPVPQKGKILPGKGWVDLACSGAVEMAIRSDGSLWRTRKAADNGVAAEPERVAEDSDWKSFVNTGWILYAYKKDGTLWFWERPGWNEESRWGDLSLRWNEPRRAGDLELASLRPLFTKTRTFSALTRNGDGAIHPTASPVPLIALAAPASRRTDWIADATPIEKPIHLYERKPEAHIEEATFVALAADGALCAWIDPPRDFGSGGRHSKGRIADGRPFQFVEDNSDIRGLLAPSRRPLWCLNVLSDQKLKENP